MIAECQIPTGSHFYNGHVTRTISGRSCQRWASQQPHAHSYDTFPDGSAGDAGNYCRNPDAAWSHGIWCLTTDPHVRWEPCDVPFCGKISMISTCTMYNVHVHVHDLPVKKQKPWMRSAC